MRASKNKKAKRKPRKTAFDRELDYAIEAVTTHEARIGASIDELVTTTSRLRLAARELEQMTQVLKRRGVLEREVEAAIDRLKATFRDGPIQINATLVQLAQDILQEQIRAVLKDQMSRIAKELAHIARDEVAAIAGEALRSLQQRQSEDQHDDEHSGGGEQDK